MNTIDQENAHEIASIFLGVNVLTDMKVVTIMSHMQYHPTYYHDIPPMNV